MVWIHGGGWSMGSPEETDPTALGFSLISAMRNIQNDFQKTFKSHLVMLSSFAFHIVWALKGFYLVIGVCLTWFMVWNGFKIIFKHLVAIKIT